MSSRYSEKFLSLFYDVVASKRIFFRTRSRKNSDDTIAKVVTYTYKFLDASFSEAIKDKILSGYYFLATNDLGPQVQTVTFTNNKLFVTTDAMLKHNETLLSQDEMAITIGETVAKLQDLGKGHGNLALNNIRFWENKAYLISPEYIYNLSEIETDPLIRFLAINLHDLDLNNRTDREAMVTLDYDYWSGELFKPLVSENVYVPVPVPCSNRGRVFVLTIQN